MEINKLKERAYEVAVKHGWYDENWSMIHRIMMVVTELCEAIEADRNGKHANRKMFETQLNEMKFDGVWMYCFRQYIKDTVEDEFADAVIRILTIAGQMGIVFPEDTLSEENISNGLRVANEASKSKLLDREYTLPEELYMLISDLVSLEDETTHIGEVLFMLLVIAKRRGIDIEWHVEQKMKYNELRTYRHGGKKY